MRILDARSWGGRRRQDGSQTFISLTTSADSRRYANPPILEAIVGIEFDLLTDDPLATVKAFARTLVAGYPQQLATLTGTAQIAFGSQVGSMSQQAETGVASVSADGRSVLELTIKGMTFKRLAPYTSWPEFSTHAREVWDRFIDQVEIQPQMIGLRYINRIDIPIDIPMEELIRTYPEISRDLPQLMSQYFMRIEVPLGEHALAIIQQGFTPAVTQNEYAVLLDIDIRLPVAQTAHVWDRVEIGRTEKNRVFEACITDRLRERFG